MTAGAAMTAQANQITARGDRFAALRVRTGSRLMSNVLIKVESPIQVGHLVGVAVEQQRLALAKFTDPGLARLRPAAVGGMRVDVGIKPVVPGHLRPSGERLLLLEAYRHD